MALILVIDDEPLFRNLYAHLLQKQGHKTLLAKDGKQGLKFFTDYDPDLVMTDIIMPEKDGFEVIRDLRTKRNDIPILAFSGYSRFDSTLEIAETLGADSSWAKSENYQALFEQVSSLLKKNNGIKGQSLAAS